MSRRKHRKSAVEKFLKHLATHGLPEHPQSRESLELAERISEDAEVSKEHQEREFYKLEHAPE